MSILQYPDAINTPDLQIWNNAAFDNGESEDSATIKASWSPSVNRSESFDSDFSKENQSPVLAKSPVSRRSSIPIKPLYPNNAIGNSQGKPLEILLKRGLLEPVSVVSKIGTEEEEEKKRDERKIDMEIEELEMEITRLSTKLEALRLEKAEQNAKTVDRRGRIVPAKFMEQKQSVKISDSVKKIEEPLLSSAKSKLSRRGVSLGPSEIVAGLRSKQLGKPEITPVQPIQNRRKSCFWKLQDIDELRVTKERGKSLSLSPKSRKTVSKIQAPKQAATTAGSKRPVKKEDVVLSSIQPKRLFKDGEKSVPAKKPLKPGRVVASRYNQFTVQSTGNLLASEVRKRSLSENDKEDSTRCDKRRASLVGKSCGNQGTDSRVKKRWEIPSEVAVYTGVEEEDKSPPSIAKMGDVLPKIRTLRFAYESPRESGAAKRVAELVGRKSYFCSDEAVAAPVCQALRFLEEYVEDE